MTPIPQRHISQNPSVDIKSLSTAALYDLLQSCTVPPGSNRAKFSNWSKTFHCVPLSVFEPSDIDQCRLIFQLARREGKTVRIVGEGLSPSDLACTSDFMLRTSKLNKLRVVCVFVATSVLTESSIPLLFFFVLVEGGPRKTVCRLRWWHQTGRFRETTRDASTRFAEPGFYLNASYGRGNNDSYAWNRH